VADRPVRVSDLDAQIVVGLIMFLAGIWVSGLALAYILW
jgi:hypothetical protein